MSEERNSPNSETSNSIIISEFVIQNVGENSDRTINENENIDRTVNENENNTLLNNLTDSNVKEEVDYETKVLKKSPPFVKKVETWGKKLESRISNCQKHIEVYNERLNIPSWMSDIENYYKLMTREPETKCLMNKMLKVMTFNDLDEITDFEKKKTTYNIESGMLFEHGWYLLNMGCCKEGNKVACKPLNDIMGYFSCKKISETTNKTISTVRWLNDDNNRISVEAIKWSINEMFEPMLENLSDKKNLEAFIMIFFFTQIWKN
ncbi:hypothetical protein C6P42_004351, partial [Pichia californica]